MQRTSKAAGAGAFVRIVLRQARPGIRGAAILCWLFNAAKFSRSSMASMR